MAITSERVVDTLVEAGVTRAFTLPGLGITWSLPAFEARRDDLDVVLCRSEHIASIMAQVTGKLTRRPAVVMGQGPWIATLGGMGILEAHFTGSPMIVLTETSDYNGNGPYGVYQTMTGDYGGADVRSMLSSVTKYLCYATEPSEAIFGTQMAVKHALLPRQGPTAVVMKTTIVRSEVAEPNPGIYPTAGHLAHAPMRPDPAALTNLVDRLAAAQRPVFVAGNGVADTGAGPTLIEIAERIGAQVVTSYNAKGAVDELSPAAAGMLGTWGHPAANRVLAAADCVVMLGASMGPDYTRMRDPKLIRPGDQVLIQVDVDPRNAGWVYPVDLAVTGDVTDVLAHLRDHLSTVPRDDWTRRCETIKRENGYFELPSFPSRQGSVHHSDIVASLQTFLGPDHVLTLDAGANRIWTTFGLRVRHPGQLLVAGGVGGMGWGPAAAAAVKLARPGKRVISLSGDGGFGISMSVVATCAQYGLDVTFIVSNNSGLGMVRDNMGERRIATDFGPVDFATVGEGMGARGIRVTSPDQLGDALREAERHSGPVIIDVAVDPEASHHPAVDNRPL